MLCGPYVRKEMLYTLAPNQILAQAIRILEINQKAHAIVVFYGLPQIDIYSDHSTRSSAKVHLRWLRYGVTSCPKGAPGKQLWEHNF